tara:strand:+ start:955 stop:1167 length:213 start_codon:yes stop_codon:yes gene_type:complete
MRAGQVKVWLDQGPAVLLQQCDIEGEAIALEDVEDTVPTTEQGWVIHLLQTGEILTVHSETLHNGEEDNA